MLATAGTEVLKALPPLIAVIGLPLLAGVRGWTWLGIACFAVWSFLALASVLDSSATDMPGFGLALFGLAALGSVVAFAAGVGLRRLRS